MAITNGFGTFLEYDDIPDDERVFNADKSRMASFWVQTAKEDRWDDDTTYSVSMWDVASKVKLERWTRIHKLNKSDGAEKGQAVTGLEFDGEGELQVLLEDGTREPAQRPPEIPPWA